MQNRIIKGLNYSLKPISEEDASFIVRARLEDCNRNKFIHKISNSIDEQIEWLKKFKEFSNEYYFVIVNNFSSEPEGLISLYNLTDKKAEWGRWVVLKNSFAAIESIALVFKFAFEVLNLEEVYSLTIKDNISTVSLHDTLKEKNDGIFDKKVSLNGITYDVIKHFVDKNYYESFEKDFLSKEVIKIWRRNLKQQCGKFTFHHIGIASANFVLDSCFFGMLGYLPSSEVFYDKQQGVTGQFFTAKKQPTIEILCNLNSSKTLDYYIKNGIKLYHYGYLVKKFDLCCELLVKSGFKLIRSARYSVFFSSRIAFFVNKNMFVIEIIEE